MSSTSNSSGSIYDDYDFAHRSSERIKVKRACEESVQLLTEQLQQQTSNGGAATTTAAGQAVTTGATAINQIKRRIIAKLFSGGGKSTGQQKETAAAAAASASDTTGATTNGSRMDLGDRVYAAERITKKREKRVSVVFVRCSCCADETQRENDRDQTS